MASKLCRFLKFVYRDFRLVERIKIIKIHKFYYKIFTHNTEDDTSETYIILLESFIFFPKLINSVNHLLHQLHLRVSQPVLVGDVISVPSLAS